MEKIIELIKYDNGFRFNFIYSLYVLSFIMILSSAVCLEVYTVNYDYDYLLASKELLTGAFGVTVIALSAFYVLDRIYKYNC